jgi:hypothetical protein
VIVIGIHNLGQPKAYFVLAALIMVSLTFGIMGLGYWDDLDLAAIPDQPLAEPTGQVNIVIKISNRILELYNDGKLYKKYRIAVGKSETPTPIGDWIVIWKSYRAGDIFGTRFLGLDVPWGGYGIHGTKTLWIDKHFDNCIEHTYSK